MTYYTMTTQS